MRHQQQTSKISILVLNHDRLVQRSLYEMLSRNGHPVNLANSISHALTSISENPEQIILLDSDDACLDLIKTIKKKKYPSQFIVLGSYPDNEDAEKIIKMGAFGYLAKPAEDEAILFYIENALKKTKFKKKEDEAAEEPLKTDETYYGLVGKSRQMSDIYSIIEKVSDSRATILLSGESGTGKRIIAHAIHKADKLRRNKPFMEVSCGALPKDIIESELFGHTKGAFTGAISSRKGRFESANGGTILLDDIDSFSLNLQVKLLKVLQHKEFECVGDHKPIKVDVRIIASTNQDLEKAVAEGRFRQDLYYRINVISIHIPPLRERKEDLPSLIEYSMITSINENHKKNIKGISREAKEILMSYDWPGNVRELENIIERAVILDTDNIIGKNDLPAIILSRVEGLKKSADTDSDKNSFSHLKNALKNPERVYILKVLHDVGWNKKKAAIRLGVNRTTLYNKIKRYNIENSGIVENAACL